jgi:sarcosine oxidase
MGPPNGEVVAGALSAARAHGLPHELLDRAEIARRYGQFSVPDDFTAVYEPEAGFLVPERVITTHARLAIDAGAELHGHEPVRAWLADGAGVRVETDRGTYSAARIVFAGGAWTGKLLPAVSEKLVVTRQVLGWLTARNPDGFRIDRMGVWGIEQADGSLAYGFPLLPEDAGLKLARHGRGQVTDADGVDRAIGPADEREVRSIAERYLPGQTGPTLALKTCLYTNSPDGHFIVDRLPGRENMVVACGFSGHGFKFASVMGEVLADLATAGTPLPVGFLGVGRFGRTGGAGESDRRAVP